MGNGKRNLPKCSNESWNLFKNTLSDNKWSFSPCDTCIIIKTLCYMLNIITNNFIKIIGRWLHGAINLNFFINETRSH